MVMNFKKSRVTFSDVAGYKKRDTGTSKNPQKVSSRLTDSREKAREAGVKNTDPSVQQSVTKANVIEKSIRKRSSGKAPKGGQ
jgi:hypothetical protein